jgi:DNA processing protein
MTDKYLITLGQIYGLKLAVLKTLLKHLASYESIWRSSAADLEKIGVKQILLNKIQDTKKLDPDALISNLAKEKIDVVSLLDPEYPFLLKQIKNPPLLLYYRGQKEILNKQPAISIVGSRNNTNYGKNFVEKLMRSSKGIVKTTVSGLAMGIDTIVHQQSIANNINTVAVVASGLDWASFEPQRQRNLAEKIIYHGGAIISDFPLGTTVQTFFFPQRNRLIAGLTKATLIIEAGKKSGALITARWANDYGREVFALPGDIYRYQSSGCNWLLGQGANVLTDISDVLPLFNLDQKIIKPINTIKLNDKQEAIINCLRVQCLNADELSQSTALPLGQLIIELSQLELLELISRDLFGNYQIK